MRGHRRQRRMLLQVWNPLNSKVADAHATCASRFVCRRHFKQIGRSVECVRDVACVQNATAGSTINPRTPGSIPEGGDAPDIAENNQPSAG